MELSKDRGNNLYMTWASSSDRTWYKSSNWGASWTAMTTTTKPLWGITFDQSGVHGFADSYSQVSGYIQTEGTYS
jgi:hypothetical protein